MCLYDELCSSLIPNDILTLQIDNNLEQNTLTFIGKRLFGQHTIDYSCTIANQFIINTSPITCDVLEINNLSYGFLNGEMSIENGAQSFKLENTEYLISITQNPNGTLNSFEIALKNAA
jgi:hypothetical protein